MSYVTDEMGRDHALSQSEFESIYAKVPRLTVEIVIRRSEDGAIYLTKRAIEPCKGQWHLPGGTVRFGEPLIMAVKRIAYRELHVNIEFASLAGYVEYPSHYRHGLDSPVGIVFEVSKYVGILEPNDEASAGQWFTKLPANTHADQDIFLVQQGFLTKAE